MANKEDVKRAVHKRALASVKAYKDTFTTIHGKKVLHDLMRESGYAETNFVHGDPYCTAYREGARSLVIHILKRLNVDIEELAKMTTESSEHDIFKGG